MDYDHIPDPHFIVSLSSGTSSAVAADRIMERYGKGDNVHLVFADVKSFDGRGGEDADNYRFLADLERRWQKSIIWLQDGRSTTDVWDEKRIIPNDQICPCTYELKIKLIIEYAKGIQAQGFNAFMAIGMNAKDARPNNRSPQGRLKAPIKNWAGSGLAFVLYPLLDNPVVHNSDHAHQIVSSWGIKPPRMGAYGFPNANCSGTCPKAGIGTWRKTLKEFPERYAEIEAWETNKRKDPHFTPYTILTRRENGVDVNVSLEQLRLETEAANTRQRRLFEMEDDMVTTCGVECGVGSEWN